MNDYSNPLVTVVTATFNALEGLRETVGSVSQQTFEAVEHVIVDGGSNDGTKEYLESLGDTVRWVSEPDDGIADAMNKGISMARGEYVLVLHAEDCFADRGSLSRASQYLGGSRDLVGFDVMLDNMADGGGSIRHKARPFSLITDFRMLVPHQGLFCRKTVFDRIGGFDCSFRIGMDYDHLLRAKRSGLRLHVVRQVLARMPATGISSRDDWPARHALLMEQWRAQRTNFPGPLSRVVYALFWSVFYPAFFIKRKIFRKWRFY